MQPLWLRLEDARKEIPDIESRVSLLDADFKCAQEAARRAEEEHKV